MQDIVAAAAGDIGYVDNQITGDTIKSADDVTRHRWFFDVFRGEALSRQASGELIGKAAEPWRP